MRGSAKLTVRTTREQPAPGSNEVMISGALTDDAGEALTLQTLTITVTRETNPTDERTAAGIRGARACEGVRDQRRPTAWDVRPGGANEVVVMTDDGGRFCFRARLDPDRYRAAVVYRPATQGLVDGVEREVPFDLSRRGLALRFDPVPRIVSLDGPNVAVDGVALVDDEASSRVAPGLSIALSNEKNELARMVTDQTGRAHFVVPTSKLGSPGHGELRLSFAGDNDTTPATYSEEIERQVAVRLKPRTSASGEVTVGLPEDGVPLIVDVESSAGPVPQGAIEARIGETVVGAGSVEHGTSHFTMTFASAGSDATVMLRYVSPSPWYQAEAELPLRIRIEGPSLLSKLPVLVAGLAMLGFFLAGRISGQKSKVEPASSPDEGRVKADARPRIEVVRPAAAGERRWSGRVTDAHEGKPVEGVRVWIERGTFDGRAVLASVETDARGEFVLEDIGQPSGDERLGAEGRYHSRFVQDLPPPGDIAVALSARRRTVLAKLVTWARRKGAPFDARPEPTPGHVRNAAAGDAPTSLWASAIEEAAFGPGEVDARTEQELDRLAPEDANRGARPGDDVAELPR